MESINSATSLRTDLGVEEAMTTFEQQTDALPVPSSNEGDPFTTWETEDNTEGKNPISRWLQEAWAPHDEEMTRQSKEFAHDFVNTLEDRLASATKHWLVAKKAMKEGAIAGGIIGGVTQATKAISAAYRSSPEAQASVQATNEAIGQAAQSTGEAVGQAAQSAGETVGRGIEAGIGLANQALQMGSEAMQTYGPQVAEAVKTTAEVGGALTAGVVLGAETFVLGRETLNATKETARNAADFTTDYLESAIPAFGDAIVDEGIPGTAKLLLGDALRSRPMQAASNFLETSGKFVLSGVQTVLDARSAIETIPRDLLASGSEILNKAVTMASEKSEEVAGAILRSSDQSMRESAKLAGVDLDRQQRNIQDTALHSQTSVLKRNLQEAFPDNKIAQATVRAIDFISETTFKGASLAESMSQEAQRFHEESEAHRKQAEEVANVMANLDGLVTGKAKEASQQLLAEASEHAARCEAKIQEHAKRYPAKDVKGTFVTGAKKLWNNIGKRYSSKSPIFGKIAQGVKAMKQNLNQAQA